MEGGRQKTWPGLAAIVFAIVLGLPVGIGTYTFIYAKGYSYLSNDPRACVNCHVMQGQYDSWRHSSHHAFAVCNDCHTPGNAVAKYYAKAANGFWHSFAFTTQRFHEPIQIKEHNRARAETSCRTCHAEFLAASPLTQHRLEETSCLKCHSSVGHAK